jgi:hypothetical protein
VWNRSTVQWTESTAPVQGSTDSSLNEGHHFPDQRTGLKQRRGISSFNLIHSSQNGRLQCFLLQRNWRNRGSGEASMPSFRESSSSRYEASFSNLKASTRSRRWEVSVLTTYRGGNRPRKAGDGEATRELGNSGGGDFRWCFGSGNGFGDGGDGSRSSF